MAEPVDTQTERYELTDVPIMEEGTWNGHVFTSEDLDDIANNFIELKAELKPYLKLGHNEDQALLKSDGLPSAGWISELKREGTRLLAKIVNIPKTIFELIKKGAYGRFSSEIYFDAVIKDKNYKRALKAVALLGADTPAVTSMPDLLNVYSFSYDKIVNTNEGEKFMDEIKTEMLTMKSENDLLKDSNVKLADRIAKFEAEKKAEKIQDYLEKKVTEGKIVPAQFDSLKKLMSEDDVVKFSFDDKFELLKSFIDNTPVNLELGEKSVNFKKESLTADDELHEKVLTFSKENKVSYRDALHTVIRGEK